MIVKNECHLETAGPANQEQPERNPDQQGERGWLTSQSCPVTSTHKQGVVCVPRISQTNHTQIITNNKSINNDNYYFFNKKGSETVFKHLYKKYCKSSNLRVIPHNLCRKQNSLTSVRQNSIENYSFFLHKHII